MRGPLTRLTVLQTPLQVSLRIAFPPSHGPTPLSAHALDFTHPSYVDDLADSHQQFLKRTPDPTWLAGSMKRDRGGGLAERAMPRSLALGCITSPQCKIFAHTTVFLAVITTELQHTTIPPPFPIRPSSYARRSPDTTPTDDCAECERCRAKG